MVNKHKGEVKLLLDKERTLKFTFNSLVLFEDITGKSMTELGKGTMKMRDIRTLLFVGLYHEDKTLNEDYVGELIELDKMNDIVGKIEEAMAVFQ